VRPSLFQQILVAVACAAFAASLPPCLAMALRAHLGSAAFAALAASGLPLGICAGAFFAARIGRRARRLAEGAMDLTRGKLGVQLDPGGDDDLGQLAQVFNYASQQMLAFDGETRRLYHNLEAGTLETMVVIANIIDSKDSFTHGHSQRVGDWASEIGRELKLTELEVRHLLYAGLLHDVGKVGVIEPILGKRGALTDEEMDAMRAHPVIGISIIGQVGFLKPVLPAVRHHHERWDGAGYPDKLAAEAIPMVARVVAVADTWDALTSHRPYQEPMPSEQALEVMERLNGKAFDPQVVAALSRVVRRKREKGQRVSVADPPG
jgi:HD-GYP domain-containing protein (c-di-GMP phosphodiesterase class II)